MDAKTRTAKWNFEAAYDSETVSEGEMANIVADLNTQSTKFDYRFRAGRGTTDWIVERRRA